MPPRPLGHLCLNPLDARLSIGERDVGNWHALDLSGCRDAKRLKRMGRRRSQKRIVDLHSLSAIIMRVDRTKREEMLTWRSTASVLSFLATTCASLAADGAALVSLADAGAW